MVDNEEIEIYGVNARIKNATYITVFSCVKLHYVHLVGYVLEM